jgi:leader peptidase (prepilin peptidase)/N-methyltransferase
MQVVYSFETLLLGWVLGLLVNYLSDVLPFSRSLTPPECRQCQHEWPIVAYLSLRKCPTCGLKRSKRTWFIQVFIPLVLLWLMLTPPGRLSLWMCAILLAFFAIVAVVDFEHRAILYQESIAGTIIGLAIGVYLHGLLPTLIGGLVGFAIMLVLYYLGILFARLIARLRGQVTSDVGLGFGDVTLAGVLGLMLGWPGITAGLILAILLAGVVSAVYLFIQIIGRRYQVFSSIPYAPFLVLGSAILLFRP